MAPSIARLSVLFQDASGTDIPLHGRYFLWVVPPDRFGAGRRPSWLIARSASGRVVYRQFLYPRQHCVYPGRDPLCRNYAMGTG